MEYQILNSTAETFGNILGWFTMVADIAWRILFCIIALKVIKLLDKKSN